MEKLVRLAVHAGMSIVASIFIGRCAGRDAGWAAFCLFAMVDTWVERLRERA